MLKNPTFLSTSLLCLSLGSALVAQRAPEVEPNDTVGQAQALVAGRHVTANLAAGEQDWFSFTLSAPAEVHLLTSGNFNVNPSVDTVVFIYDATGTNRLAWNDGQRGVHSDCGVNLPAGSYTGLVIGRTATVMGDYGLDFIVLPAAIINVVEAAEPNGDPFFGGAPTPIVPGDTFTGELLTTADTDWYSFTLSARAVVQAIVYDDGGVPQLDNTLIKFFQETSPGTWVTFGTSSSITNSHRAFNLAHPQVLLPGNYAIEISAGTSTTVNPAPQNYTKVGKYGVRTIMMAMPGTNTVVEAPEPNNTLLTSGFITLGDNATGNISGMNEGDWYAFMVTGPTTIAAMSDGAGVTPITDTTLRLWDVDGTSLASASTGGPSSHGKLVYTIPAAGTYFLEVAGGLFASTGDYVLYTGASDPMYVSGVFRTTPPSTNACTGSNALRPALTAASSEVPQAGSTFVCRLQNALPNAIAAPMIGLSGSYTNGGATPLPIDLGAIGAPGCALRVDPLSSWGIVADGSGIAYIDLTVSANPSLRGISVYMQTVLFDLANNSLGISMSNDVRIQVGDRGY